MRILFVLDPSVVLTEPYAGGTEAFTVDLATELSAQGHRIDVIAASVSESSPFQLIEFNESPYSMRDDIHSEHQGQRIYKEIQFGLMNLNEYDLIHYHSFNPRIYEYASVHSKPSLVTLHIPLNEKLGHALSLYQNRSRPTFVAVSERLKQSWLPVLSHSPSDFYTIPNGIDVSKWSNNHDGSDEYMLWSGRINVHKNPLDAIRLAQLIDTPLVMTGRIDDQEYFDEHILPNISDTIRYAGHVDQRSLHNMASKALCFLATATWEEPFGLSIVEMLASGLSVVGYGSAIPPEFRALKGVFYSDKQSVAALEGLVRESRKASAEECRAAAEEFSLQQCAEKYEALYQRVILKDREE